MKLLQEFIIDERLENNLFDSLELFITLNENYRGIIKEDSEIFRLFNNYKEILKIILDKIKKLSKDFEEEQLIISINSVQEYPKNVLINLYRQNEGISGAFLSSNKQGDVEIELNLGENFRMKWNRISFIILHELAHGYKEFINITNNQPSIFGDFTREYKTASRNLGKQNNYIIRYIAFLKYFFNKQEIDAYLATLELCLTQIIDKIKPSYKDLKFDKFKKLLKEEDVWKTYFNFGKFVINIDNINDEELELAYAEICETSEDENKRINKRIEYLKRIANEEIIVKPSNNKISPKSASDIRKECKEAWREFDKKFNSTFLDVFENIPLTNNTKFF